MDFNIYCTDDNFVEHGYPQSITEAGFELKSRTLYDENGTIYGYEFHIDLTFVEDFVKLQNALGCELILTHNQTIEIYNDYRE
jgi:hypothetical protein